jgi:hypothetical protein
MPLLVRRGIPPAGIAAGIPTRRQNFRLGGARKRRVILIILLPEIAHGSLYPILRRAYNLTVPLPEFPTSPESTGAIFERLQTGAARTSQRY